MPLLPLADRVTTTDISGIRKVFDLAAKLKNPINLSIGQPDFDVPVPVQDAAIAAIREGHNRYTRTQGATEFRQALLDTTEIPCKDEQLLVTSAVSGGLLLSFLSILNAGDEVLIPDPYFVMYKQLPLMLDAKPVYYNTYPRWEMDLGEIESLITPRTRAIVFSSPANPTGAVYGSEQLQALGALLKRHNLLAISDEIYRDFVYDRPFASLRQYYENTLVLRGFSKSHAMTGWRLGYAIGPEPLIQAMTKFQQFTYVCAPSMAQYAGAAALASPMEEQVAAYKVKRDLIYNGLIRSGYTVEKPGGAFYILPEVPWGTDEEFVAACIENELLVIPGSVFSEQTTHFRISYAASNDTIKRGLEVLNRLRNQQGK